MKKILLCTLLFWLAAFTSQAQINNLAPVWADVFSGTGTATGNKVAIDATNGNVYTIGTFTGTVDFNPGAGVANRTSTGGSTDVFIVATNSAGGFLWEQVVNSGAGADQGTGIVVSPTNGIYVCGWVSTITGTSTFVTRLSVTNGVILNNRIMGGSFSALVHSLCIDSLGDVIVVGGFEGSVNFGEGLGGNVTASNGGDILVLKLNATLGGTWLRVYGGNADEAAYGVVTSAENAIYFTAGFRSTTINFGGVTLNNSGGSNGNNEIAVVRLTASGATSWATAAGGAGNDRGWDIALGANNGLYCTGEFSGTANFGGGTRTSNGLLDVFVSRLNATTGVFNWTTSFGGAGNDIGRRIALDNASNVHTVGHFVGTVNFDPNGVRNLVGTGSNNGFISRLDVNGNFLSANQISSNGSATANGMALDATNRIHITGNFVNTVRLNPSNTSLNNVISNTVAAYTAVYIPFACAVTINPASLPNNTVGTAYNQTLTQTGLTSAPIWTITAGTLPAGLTLNATTGVISGTTNVLGASTFTVSIGDATCSQTKTYTIVVACPIITIFPETVVVPPPGGDGGAKSSVSSVTSTTLDGGAVGVAYTQIFTQMGLAPSSAVWTVSAGVLPAGLTLDATGVLSGTPTQAGTFCFIVQVFDQFCSQTKEYCITIACPTILIRPKKLPNGSVCMPYTQQMLQIGLSGNPIWSITSGALPSGLALDPNTGLLNGTPTSVGTFSFVTAVADSLCSGTKNYTIVISCAPAPAAPIVLTFPKIQENCVGAYFGANVTSSNPQAGIITYLSSDSSIAEVSSDGGIKIVGTGYVCITAFQTISGGTGVFAQQCFNVVNCKQQQPKNLILDNPKNEVNLYPNPTGGVFEVEFTKSMGTLNVEVANAAGVVVLKETFTKKNILENTNETIKLDISTLPAGLYLVKWNDGTTSGTKRVVMRIRG